MAQKRMFANRIIDTDSFLDLSPLAQLLYFHLGMKTDDDGFVDGAKRICRMIGADEQTLTELVEAGFLIEFPEKRLYVVTHFRINNTIQADRYQRTLHQEEFRKLSLTANKVYIWNQSGTNLETNCLQSVSTDQPKSGKVSLAQISGNGTRTEPITESDYLQLMKEGFSRNQIDEVISRINWNGIEHPYNYLMKVLKGSPQKQVSAQAYTQREYSADEESPEERLQRYKAELQ